MLAIVQDKHKKLTWTTHPKPVANDKECIVRVHACGLNRADVLQSKGLYSPPTGTTEVLGLEFAGEMENGQRVMGLVPGGAFAEYIVTQEQCVVPIPDNLTYVEAAAIMEGVATTLQALSYATIPLADSHVVVTASTGGVGSLAVQVASVLGAHTTAVVRNNLFTTDLLGLGADRVLDLKEWLTGAAGPRADTVLEFYSGDSMSASCKHAKPGGTIVCLGLLRGVKSEVPMSTFLMKGLHLHAFTMRNLSDSKRALNTTFVKDFLAKHSVTPLVREVYPIQNIHEAMEDMQRGGQLGKIVLTV